MKLEDFLIGCGKYGMGAIVAGSIGACAGYTFSTIFGGNIMLTTQVIAIAAIAAFLFRQCVEHGFDELNKAQRNFIYILGASFGGAAFTAALKNLEIISRIGTSVLAFCLLTINGLALVASFNGDHLFTDT